jgi:hypothetical protein
MKHSMVQPVPVVERMDLLAQEWEQRADRRSAFLRCYAMMTGNTLRAIDQSQFRDPQWVARLLHLFADYYFLALDAYQQDDTGTPTVWRVAFDAAAQQQTQVLQDLLLGINAHINYDLVLTLVDMLEPEWASLSPDQRRQRYEDHSHVNTIIAATVDSVQDQVVTPDSRWLGVVDWALGPLDEHMAAQMIRRWREEVWQQAVQMLATADPDERADLRRLLADQSLERSQQILARRVDRLVAELF